MANEIAAGSVVYRITDDGIEVLLEIREEGAQLGLPLGPAPPEAKDGEDHEWQLGAAGMVVGHIGESLGEVAQWSVRHTPEGVKRTLRRTRFYPMRFLRMGDLGSDGTSEQVCWMPITEAARRVTSGGEQQMIRKAQRRLQQEHAALLRPSSRRL